MIKLFWVLGWLCFVALLVFSFPLLVIWSLNTLFGLQLPFTVATWFAVVVLNIFVLPKTPGSIKVKTK